MSWIDEYSDRNRGLIRPPRNSPAAVRAEWREKAGVSFHNSDAAYEHRKHSAEKQRRINNINR